MKCPKCNCDSEFQVVTKTGKKYAQCDKCGALLTADDLKQIMQRGKRVDEQKRRPLTADEPKQTMPQPPPQKEKAKTSEIIAGSITLIILAVIGIKLFSVFISDDKAASAEQTKQQETDGYGWTKDDHLRFRSYTWSISDKYVANYKTSFADDSEWTYARFDNEGKIMVKTTYAFKNMNEKQNVIFIFTEGEDNDEDGEPDVYYPHFLSIVNNIYVNDGSCNEFFQDLQESMQYFQ